MDQSTARRKYSAQKKQAQMRGIEWELTFDEWLDWWGIDLDRRGVRAGQLMMCRVGDEGPYKLGNIYKGTPADNGRTRGAMYWNKYGPRMKEEIRRAQQAWDAAIERAKIMSGQLGCNEAKYLKAHSA